MILNQNGVLNKFPIFNTLSTGTLSALERNMRVFSLKPGQMLFHRGDPARAFYVVLEGAIQLTEHTANGRQVNLQIFGEGDIFGLLALSGKYPYPHSSYAVGKTSVGAFCGDDGIQLIKTHPDFALFVTNFLIALVHQAHDRIKQLSTEQTEQRLARLLICYAEKFGKPDADCISINLTLSQQMLADTLGVALETVNRTLRQWEQEAFIRCSRQHIDILDMDELKNVIYRPECYES